jgi:hypothetical protein
LPKITVTVPASGAAAGNVFIANLQFGPCPTDTHLLILDNAAEPLFYRRFAPCALLLDFKTQPNGLLTYWNPDVRGFQAMDHTYTVIDTFRAGNGYRTDEHEFQLLPNGHALLMIYDRQVISNTQQIIPNGRITATVIGLVLQELDVDKNVVFEWRSWDHFLITDTTPVYLTREPVDYVHGNSIDVDTDGNLLISNRNMNEVTKIDRQTGDIIWRLGGKNNQFAFVNDERGFSHQHDARRLANGNLSLYDNGNLHEPAYSRAVEYQLDEVNKVATLVLEYRSTPDVFAFAMGSNQQLPNHNVLVGWGASSTPAVTEFRPDGAKAFELALSPGDFTYRAFRAPWQGYPTTAPVLVAVTTTAPTLYYSWNGATEVVGYRVYGGKTAEPDTLIDTTLKTSFETETALTADVLNQFCYFRVMPVDKQGNETRNSNTVFVDTPGCQPPPTPLPLSLRKTLSISGIEPACSNVSTVQAPISTTVVYCYAVKNDGATSYTRHTLEDDHLGRLLDDASFALNPGDTYTVMVTATLAISTTNVATWTASAGAIRPADGQGIHPDDPLLAARNSTIATVIISSPDDDLDFDRIPDNVEGAANLDGDNLPNFLDTDSDGDGKPDQEEAGPNPRQPHDSDEDGVPDFLTPAQERGVYFPFISR